MKGPAWLRWQPLRCNPWLVLYGAVALFLPLVIPAFFLWHRGGTEFWQAYETWAQRYEAGPPRLFCIFYCLAAEGFEEVFLPAYKGQAAGA
jgi:hypothetical protein